MNPSEKSNSVKKENYNEIDQTKNENLNFKEKNKGKLLS